VLLKEFIRRKGMGGIPYNQQREISWKYKCTVCDEENEYVDEPHTRKMAKYHVENTKHKVIVSFELVACNNLGTIKGDR
jgi:hypothetical protein